MFSRIRPRAAHATVNGGAGLVTTVEGRVESVMAVTVRNGRIVALDIIADPDRLASLEDDRG
jgi:RNA polymerase sigma-70 factor (ECF subfamily)